MELTADGENLRALEKDDALVAKVVAFLGQSRCFLVVQMRVEQLVRRLSLSRHSLPAVSSGRAIVRTASQAFPSSLRPPPPAPSAPRPSARTETNRRSLLRREVHQRVCVEQLEASQPHDGGTCGNSPLPGVIRKKPRQRWQILLVSRAYLFRAQERGSVRSLWKQARGELWRCGGKGR